MLHIYFLLSFRVILYQLSRTDIDQVSNTGNSVQIKVYFVKLKENKKKISSFAGGSTEYVEFTNSIPHKMQYRFVISWYFLLFEIILSLTKALLKMQHRLLLMEQQQLWFNKALLLKLLEILEVHCKHKEIRCTC